MSGGNTHYLDIPESEIVTPSKQVFDGVIWGYKFSPDDGSSTTTLSYSFPGPDSMYHAASYAELEWPDRGLEKLTSAQIASFETVLQQVASFTNLKFVPVADGGENAGTIRPVWTGYLRGENSAGNAIEPHPPTPAAGDVWFASRVLKDAPHIAFVSVAIHELGHALGLKHPHVPMEFFPTLDASWHGREYSIMSYKMSVRHPSAVSEDLGPQTFMYIDILALQYLYGVNTETTGGDDTYTYDQSGQHYLTIWDAGGNDTIEVTGGDRHVNIDLNPGSWNKVGTTVTYDNGQDLMPEQKTVFITPETVIENASGAAGPDILTGNNGANILKGNEGNDSLFGMAGDDKLVGGKGDDKLYGHEGDDDIWAGPGDMGDDQIVGGAGNDELGGGAGNDLIVGDDSELSSDGHDTLYGGIGNDTLVGGGWSDGKVIKNSAYDLGEDLPDNVAADKLWAGDGDDLIVAAGGNDTMGAGTGDDLIEAGAGNDKVFAGNGQDTLDGGKGDDHMFGGAGNDTLLGGLGADTLWGGSGDDTLSGGAGSDSFGFGAASGQDVIADFDLDEDVLVLSGTETVFANSGDIINHATDVSDGALIDLGGGANVLLIGLTANALQDIILQTD